MSELFVVKCGGGEVGRGVLLVRDDSSLAEHSGL